MSELVLVIEIEVWLWLLVVVGIVIYGMLTGKINTRRMLFDKVDGNFSPGRVQLLTITLAVAMSYIVQAAQHPKTLPDIPQQTLLLLTGSHAVYLGGKASSLLAMFRSGK